MPAKIDISGERYGRLTAIKSTGRKGNAMIWECLCDCGSITKSALSNLRNGHTKSCGCLSVETTVKRSTVHGAAPRGATTAEYRTWQGMIRRCHNPKDKSFPRYGGSGVIVCPEWRESFTRFLADMGNRPSPRHSIDRKRNTEGYKKGNCRWATTVQQANNHENNVRITHHGITKNVGQWAAHLGIKPATLAWRIRAGWDVRKAFLNHDYRT